VDPCLSDAAAAKGATRAVPAPFSASALAPDYLLCTHDHVDHWDPVGAPDILQNHPRCTLLAPASVRRLARAVGIAAERIRPFDVGESISAGPFHLTALPTLHSDPLGVGFHLRAGALSLYQSGDTEYTTVLAKDLAARLAALAPRLHLRSSALTDVSAT
jgi:L-ascorbate metabolism protein UlaG (beta-lactamase superfamily)